MKTSTALLVLAVATTATMNGAAHAATAPKEYPECQEGDKQSYFGALTQELQQCSSKTKYDFTSLPTPDQREALCKCKSLIEKLPYIRVPRCRLDLEGNLYKFKDAITSIFSECGSIAVEEVPPPTLAPGASSAGSAAEEPTAKPKATPTMTPKPTSKAPKTTAPAVNESGEPASGSGETEDIQTPKPKPQDSKTKEPATPATSKPAAAAAVPTATPKSAASTALAGAAAAIVSAAVAALL
ncbi:hypothetical protein ATCC90586_009893 [Pythium insidiosum]|nr:hypothetical protein ATCC90586_009893 [Pythium insidiosum]